MTTILLTASRALLDTKTAKAWFRKEFFAVYDALPCRLPGDERNMIVFGDASSDKYMRSLYESEHDEEDGAWPMIITYKLDGTIEIYDTSLWGNATVVNWLWATPEELATMLPKRLPLVRNEAMVNACSPDTICHAFIAPWSKTHGTEHTLGLAARRGLQVVRHDCPKEYGINA